MEVDDLSLKKGDIRMVTMNDVAKRAGVSRGTVSNVINNIKVKESSRIKVEEAIAELGYTPNENARGLKINRTSTIVLIIPTIWNPFFSELAFRIQLELRKYNLKMLLCNSKDEYLIELEYLKMAQQNRVDGIIAITYSSIEAYLNMNVPMVSIERVFNGGIPTVSSDNYSGGYLAAQKLHEGGCKNLLLVGKAQTNNEAVDKRQRGFVDYCEKHHLNYELYYIRSKIENFEQHVYNLMTKYYQCGVKYDGIFAVTDRYANYCIQRLQELNISIPGEVQVIGYDGAKSHESEPYTISTIRQPIDLLAIKSVETLVQVIGGKQVDPLIQFPVNYIRGKTTK